MSENLASTLHLLLCKKTHNDNECEWYSEEQKAERWQLPCHLPWLKRAESFLLLSGRTEEEMEALFKRLIGVIWEVTYLKERNPTLVEVIDTILIEATNKPIMPSTEQPPS